MRLSANQYFAKDVIRETSKLLNIPEDVVSSVLSATTLYILKDCSKQADVSDFITVRVPNVCDIRVAIGSSSKKSLTTTSFDFDPTFKYMLRQSVITDKDYLHEAIIEGTSELIVDKFIKALHDVQNEEGDD